ncbi:MAG: hypothetical protein ACRBG0_26640 [Lewinella sp.]|uniref:hypothetical protein n=1 Tax=Lewinella sp. TaxID=2004506 RepID=UPI003D6A3ACB
MNVLVIILLIALVLLGFYAQGLRKELKDEKAEKVLKHRPSSFLKGIRDNSTSKVLKEAAKRILEKRKK